MNRRFFLKLNAATAIGLTLRGSPVFGQTTAVSPEVSALSTYMAAAAARPLPAEVVEQAKHHLLDTFASMLSGSLRSEWKVPFATA